MVSQTQKQTIFVVQATDLEVYATVVDGRLESRHRVVLPLRVQTKQLNASISQFPALHEHWVVTFLVYVALQSSSSNDNIFLLRRSYPQKTRFGHPQGTFPGSTCLLFFLPFLLSSHLFANSKIARTKFPFCSTFLSVLSAILKTYTPSFQSSLGRRHFGEGSIIRNRSNPSSRKILNLRPYNPTYKLLLLACAVNCIAGTILAIP